MGEVTLSAHAQGKGAREPGSPPEVVLRPALDWILVKRAKDKATALVIPDGYERAQENVLWHVLAVGPGRHSEYSANLLPPPPYRPGDLVLASNGAGSKYQHHRDGEVRFMRPGDILAAVELA